MNGANTKRTEAIRLATSILNELADLEDLQYRNANKDGRLTYDQVFAGRHALARAAELEIEVRTHRNSYAFAPLLGEPAWDILLDMFICWAQGRPMRMKDAALASKAPEATAHRYICTMADKGLLRRSRQSRDGRVVSIDLTETALIEIGTYLARRTEQTVISKL